jgi:hypothetical protein
VTTELFAYLAGGLMIDNFIEIDSLRWGRFPFETRKTETFFFVRR